MLKPTSFLVLLLACGCGLDAPARAASLSYTDRSTSSIERKLWNPSSGATGLITQFDESTEETGESFNFPEGLTPDQAIQEVRKAIELQKKHGGNHGGQANFAKLSEPARTVEIWISAFIPGNIPGYTEIVPLGEHKEKSAIPGPPVPNAISLRRFLGIKVPYNWS